MDARRQHGFTLWELMLALLVAGIVLGIGVPNVKEFQRSGVVTGAANDLVTGLLAARSEAVRRQAPVTLCLSDDPLANPPTCSPGAVVDSTRGFFVWVDENGNLDPLGAPDLSDSSDGNAVVDADETVLVRGTAIDSTSSLRLSANCGHVAFSPNGWVRAVPALCATTFATAQFVVYCDDRGRRATAGNLSSARAIRIDPTGRGTVLTETVQVDPAIATTGATCP